MNVAEKLTGWIGYLGVVITAVISGAGLFPDYFNRGSKRDRIIFFAILFLCVCMSLYALYGTNRQHIDDVARISTLQATVVSAQNSEQANAQRFIQGQKDETKQFTDKYSELSGRLEVLDTQIKTADLRKEADELRTELKKNQAAMAPPPRVDLTFSLKDSVIPIVMDTLPVKDGIVHISFMVINSTSIDALEGEIVLYICDLCKFSKEPDRFQKVAGANDRQRNFSFQHVLAHSQLAGLEADIQPPVGSDQIAFAVKLICKTCVPAEIGLPLPAHTATIYLRR